LQYSNSGLLTKVKLSHQLHCFTPLEYSRSEVQPYSIVVCKTVHSTKMTSRSALRSIAVKFLQLSTHRWRISYCTISYIRFLVICRFGSYRLAPEHVFPAAFEDCVTATKFFISNANLFNVDPERIAIGGISCSRFDETFASINAK
jgi:hypothetical protein